IAEKDRLELNNAVYVTQCVVWESLREEHPHVIFKFHIRNCAIYAITIEPTLKGFISLNSRRLMGEITVSSVLPHNLQHCWGDHFQIRQELTASDVREIDVLDSALPLQGCYDFQNLR